MSGGAGGPGEFAVRLRSLRQRAVLTQEELAERAGLTAKGIGALERGERRQPQPHTVRALADALGLDDADRAFLTGAGSSVAAGPVPTLPAPLVGRDADRAEVVRLLSDGATRLLTLTGPGGVGKTSLALAVAGAFPGAVTVVELAPLRDAALVLPTVARALGARQPDLDGLVAFLGRRAHLLVLDNVEHVLPAAPEVAELLARCPGLVVLGHQPGGAADPRRAGAAAGPPAGAGRLGPGLGRRFPRRPGVPRPGARQRPGRRAHRRDRRRRRGDLPAAGRAAARAGAGRRAHPVPLPRGAARPAGLRGQLAGRAGPAGPAADDAGHPGLEPRPAHHGRAGAAAPAVGVRRRLLAGGSRARRRTRGDDVVPVLGGLVEQSLLVADGDRLRLLEPVRQYAATRLAEAGEADAVADRAAGFFTGLAAGARAGLRTADQAHWLDRLQVEHGNLSATFGRLVARGRAGEAARLAADLWLYWALRGNAAAGLAELARVPAGP